MRTRILGTLAAALLLTGCGAPHDALVQDAVADLVADLASGSFDSGVILDPTDAEIWHAYALGPLIDVWRTVEAGDVVVDDTTAEVALAWTFHFDDGAVTVPAHATLADDGGQWHLAWVPTVLHDAATEASSYELTGVGGEIVVTLHGAVGGAGGGVGDIVVGSVGG